MNEILKKRNEEKGVKMNQQLIGQKPIKQQVKVDLNDCVSLFCRSCKKLGKDRDKFKAIIRFKVIPMTMSPDGKERIVSMIQYVCTKCGMLLTNDKGEVINRIEG